MPNRVFGVIEGFYRRPYTFEQRLDLIKFLSDLKLNTYMYGPKADPFHRKKWSEPYPTQKIREFEKLVELCNALSVAFVYALSPINRLNLEKIVRKIDSIIAAGVTQFSLFFDDIPASLNQETADEQVEVANGLYEHLSAKIENVTLTFCPTQYRGFRKTQYIKTMSHKLRREIDVFWTGKSVVAKKITETEIDRINSIVKRPVLIWDNIFANDYIPGRIMRFPYRNRAPGIVRKVRGILINPMNNYKESKPLIHTAAQFFHDPFNYDPGRAWITALNTTTHADFRHP
ncbi:hypothetical protein AMJ83_04540 [candidate division WOR_3 bacterium SM23_42]|uniref:GH84 domain-containing protein n=1 Tax=candidate division WOR_3 bacterium SM23_42 TaxID=1703779 RepID=A0A0S8FUW2_UNCW3|nr:MAG: hypothetical protein AMJ83_04540 [candidate division WOR_3 bacterium SM23_42]